MIDQTRATERHRVVIVAARVGGRALPLAWRGEAAAGTTRPAEAPPAAGGGARGPAGPRRAAPGAGGGCRPPPRGGAAGADGRPLPRHARADRLVPPAVLWVAAAAAAGPAAARGWRRDKPGGILRAGRAPAERRRADREAGHHPR